VTTGDSLASARPEVLAFDVNGTLSDLAPLGRRLTGFGAPAYLLQTWFAATLRDGVGLAAAGGFAPFLEVATGTLTVLLAAADGVDADPAVAAREVVAGFDELPAHPDVAPATEALAAQGLRLVTRTNGSVTTTESLLRRAGARERFERLLSVEAVRRWKPCREAYEHAVDACRTPPASIMLVAVHPWDVDGAKRAGLSACWVNRERLPYPVHLTPADLVVTTMTELPAALAAATR
jgi:2-haloacid dehalogenase